MSYLITGGTVESRLNKAREMAKTQFHASSFDTIIISIGDTPSIGIGQIRELTRQLSLKPYNSEAKVAIVHPGEILTLEAQNSLLKTLEEPNQSSILILTAPQTDFLLPTIVSRCQIIRLESKSEIALTKEEIAQLLNCFMALLSDGVGERLKFASQIGKNKEEIKEWLTKMLFALHKILLNKEQSGSPRHPEFITSVNALHISGSIPVIARSEATKQSQNNPSTSFDLKMTSLQIVEVIRRLEKTRSLIDQNINHKLALEIFLLDLPIKMNP